MANEPLFPMFVSLKDQTILVVGAGKIATRRVETLLEFQGNLKVIAPDGTDEMRQLEMSHEICWEHRNYQVSDLRGVFLVLAATSDGKLNEQIYRDCKAQGILVNVCSDRRLCDFQFPGIIRKDELTIGINASGVNHKKAKRAREVLEECLQGDEI